MSGAAYHLSALGTSTIATGGGVTLAKVVVGKAGSADSTITLRDSTDTSGRVVAVVGGGAAVSLAFDVALANGLNAVVAGTTSPDVTIVLD